MGNTTTYGRVFWINATVAVAFLIYFSVFLVVGVLIEKLTLFEVPEEWAGSLAGMYDEISGFFTMFFFLSFLVIAVIAPLAGIAGIAIAFMGPLLTYQALPDSFSLPKKLIVIAISSAALVFVIFLEFLWLFWFWLLLITRCC